MGQPVWDRPHLRQESRHLLLPRRDAPLRPGAHPEHPPQRQECPRPLGRLQRKIRKSAHDSVCHHCIAFNSTGAGGHERWLLAIEELDPTNFSLIISALLSFQCRLASVTLNTLRPFPKSIFLLRTISGPLMMWSGFKIEPSVHIFRSGSGIIYPDEGGRLEFNTLNISFCFYHLSSSLDCLKGTSKCIQTDRPAVASTHSINTA